MPAHCKGRWSLCTTLTGLVSTLVHLVTHFRPKAVSNEKSGSSECVKVHCVTMSSASICLRKLRICRSRLLYVHMCVRWSGTVDQRTNDPHTVFIRTRNITWSDDRQNRLIWVTLDDRNTHTTCQAHHTKTHVLYPLFIFLSLSLSLSFLLYQTPTKRTNMHKLHIVGHVSFRNFGPVCMQKNSVWIASASEIQ